MGEYQPGADADADWAIACAEPLQAHLRQRPEETLSFPDSLASLTNAIDRQRYIVGDDDHG